MECIFCKIINKEVPSYTIYEDNIVKVLLDINPNADGHMLVVPVKHYLDIEDIDGEVIKHIHKVSKEMYKLLKNKLHVDGLTIAQNNGSAQDVKHFHVHLIPRYKNDNVHCKYPDNKREIKAIFEILKK